LTRRVPRRWRARGRPSRSRWFSWGHHTGKPRTNARPGTFP
jgi:hypothetical protein